MERAWNSNGQTLFGCQMLQISSGVQIWTKILNLACKISEEPYY